MRTLRLFVTQNLEVPVNWVVVEEDGSVEGGVSSWDDLAVIEDANLEVYLKANCCSIHTSNMMGIRANKITENVVLGVLEDGIVDDIEDVTPVVLKTEEETVYIAIFNKQFYNGLILKLVTLDKPIKFMQSFVYSTNWVENEWTIFIDNEQQFVRTSRYGYFLLDNTQPLPIILEEMLKNSKPDAITIYAEIAQQYVDEIENRFKVPCRVGMGFEYGVNLWNFYNQKSTRFNFKMDEITKLNILSLLKTIRWFSVTMLIFWCLDIGMVSCSIQSAESKIKTNLSKIFPVQSLNIQTMQEVDKKLNNMKHQKGLYSEEDIVPLLSLFLGTVSNVGTDSMVKLSYDAGVLNVFLNDRFDTAQFVSYSNILLSQGIKATLIDYKTFKANNKTQNQSNNDNPDATAQQQVDAKWVIVLQRSLIFDFNKGGV